MGTDGSFRSIASWLCDNIASVSRNSFLCHASFWLQVKQRALWFCPTTFQAREARSLRSHVQSASCTAVEALQAQFPMFPMFPSQACGNQLLSNNLTAFLRLFESVLQALPSLYMPAHMTFCTTCTSKESNIDQSWWRRNVAASFRSIASWLCDNIASVSRNSFLCHASFWLQVKQRALWFAQLLSKPVRLDPCALMSKVPVARLLKHSRHSFQCFQCFQVKLAGTNF